MNLVEFLSNVKSNGKVKILNCDTNENCYVEIKDGCIPHGNTMRSLLDMIGAYNSGLRLGNFTDNAIIIWTPYTNFEGSCDGLSCDPSGEVRVLIDLINKELVPEDGEVDDFVEIEVKGFNIGILNDNEDLTYIIEYKGEWLDCLK